MSTNHRNAPDSTLEVSNKPSHSWCEVTHSLSWLGGSNSLQAAGLSFISVASVSHCVVNPLHWSLASLLIWGTISPADGSLLKHRKRSELIRIAPVIPLISPLTRSLLPNITPFPSLSGCLQAEVFRSVEVWLCCPPILAFPKSPHLLQGNRKLPWRHWFIVD